MALHMHNLLGRIERQYILETLSQTLSPFSISYGKNLFSVSQGSYSLSHSHIELHNPLPEFFLHKSCHIRFYHKERLLSFYSIPQPNQQNFIFLRVPQDISKEKEIPPRSDVNFNLQYKGHILRFKSNDNLSVFRIVQNPIILEEKKKSIELLSSKIGFESSTSPIAYRLFESLEWFSIIDKNTLEVKSGNLLFIDHEAVLILTEENLIKTEFSDINYFVSLQYDKRIINAEGRFQGRVRLNNFYCIWHVTFANIQEEDRRFLFESCYGSRYI